MVHFSFHERQVPDETLVTGVVIVPFVGGRCILADVRGRPGYEFTAGRTEPGETPDQAAVRELKEETGADVLQMQRVGYVLIHNDDKPIEGFPFPDSNLAVYAARCAEAGIGKSLQYESRGALVCVPDEVGGHLGFNESLYMEMLAAARKLLGV